MAKRKLSERELWLHMARRWRDAKRSTGDMWLAAPIKGAGHIRPRGICRCLGQAFGRHLRTYDVYRDALRRMNKHKPRGSIWYWWPQTKQGARTREAFCLRMAKLCAKKAGAK